MVTVIPALKMAARLAHQAQERYADDGHRRRARAVSGARRVRG